MLESWGSPITVTEVTSGEVVQVWRRETANSARLFYNAPELNLNYHGGAITLNKRMSHRWSLLAGASWGRVTSPTRGGLRSDPHILYYFDEETLATTHRPWSYRASGVDIFNATNEATMTARITQLGPTYGRLSGIQRGRLNKLGLNVEF